MHVFAAHSVPFPVQSPGHFTSSTSLGRQVLVKNGSSGLYRRRIVNHPLPGVVEPGMVICIESYIGSAEAGQGVKLEEQLLVTDSGCERLSRMPFDERLGGR